MADVAGQPTNITLTLTGEERTELVRLLEQTLKEKLIEEHRTDALSYRKEIIHEEEVLKSILQKVRA